MDITENKLKRQELEAIVSERTQRLTELIAELEGFSYSIAHDMRAPLRAMQGFAKIIREEHLTDASSEAVDFLERIMDSARRLDRMIQDVLNYSRVVRTELPMTQIDLHHLVQSIIASYPNLHNVTANVHISGHLPSVTANEAALTQVISNLLGNAVKFVAPGTTPEVNIRAERANGKVRLWVEDNGIGIPGEAHKKIFGMFQRLHANDVYEGTGIGLTIVRKALDRMGGNIGLESEKGRGSRFWIELRSSDSPQMS